MGAVPFMVFSSPLGVAIVLVCGDMVCPCLRPETEEVELACSALLCHKPCRLVHALPLVTQEQEGKGAHSPRGPPGDWGFQLLSPEGGTLQLEKVLVALLTALRLCVSYGCGHGGVGVDSVSVYVADCSSSVRVMPVSFQTRDRDPSIIRLGGGLDFGMYRLRVLDFGVFTFQSSRGVGPTKFDKFSYDVG